MSFVQAKDGRFLVDGSALQLRGFGIGSWMNIEHFMLRIPGSDHQIRQAFAEVHGEKKAARFFGDLLTCFIGDGDFKYLKSLGINCLRIAFSYRHFETDQAPGQYVDAGFRYIDRVLQLCRRHRIYAILDMHTSPGGQNPETRYDSCRRI